MQGPGFVRSLRPDPSVGLDFFQEWSSARNWQNQLPIYLDLELAAEKYLAREPIPDEQLLFAKNAHPPAAVLLALPLAPLSYPDGMLVWNLLSLAALALSLWIIARGFNVRITAWMIFATVTFALLSNPFRQQVNYGQLNLFLLVLIVGAWLAERSSRLTCAGALVGLAAALKLFPALLLVHYAIRRQWRVVVSASCAFLAVNLLALAVLGVEAFRSYATEVMPAVSSYRHVWVNISLSGFWAKWLDIGAIIPLAHSPITSIPPLAHLPALASAGLLVSALAVIAVWLRSAQRLPASLGFGVTLIAMLLLSPVAWDHYFLLLLLPIFQLWRRFPEPRWERIVLALALAPVVLSPYVFVQALAGTNTFVSLLSVSIQSFALTTLFLLAVKADPASVEQATGDPGTGSSSRPRSSVARQARRPEGMRT